MSSFPENLYFFPEVMFSPELVPAMKIFYTSCV